MSHATNAADSQLKMNIDIFVDKFFVGGARNYIRKTTQDAAWLSIGIMENTNPDLFYSSQLFSGMNIVGGGAYSLGHGLIHGYLKNAAYRHLKRAMANLNALPAKEIIFYHDESLCGIDMARKMEIEIGFTPVSLLEWMVRTVRENRQQVLPLDINAAVQLPCSSCFGVDRNALLDTLFDLIGVKRVRRCYDYGNRLCCGARGYFGLISGDIQADADLSDERVHKNVADAKAAGASHMVTMCPYCYAAIAPSALEAGLFPIQVEGLSSMALYRHMPPGGVVFK